MQDPLVSVIIPCYNTVRFVREAVESVHAQTYRNYDVTVVDDGSSDGSASVVEQLPGVNLIRQANQGVSGARNTGMRATRGEYLVFLDADDRLHPDALRIGLETHAARPGHGFVFGFSHSVGAGGDARGERAIEPYPDASFRTFLAGRSIVPPAVAMFRRSAVEAAGLFRLGMKLAEDHDLYLRVAKISPIYCHGRVIADYRSHPGNVCKRSTTQLYLGLLEAMDYQRDFVRGKPDLEAADRHGRGHWARVFGSSMSWEFYRLVRSARLLRAARTASILVRYYPRGFWDVGRVYTRRLAGRRRVADPAR